MWLFTPFPPVLRSTFFALVLTCVGACTPTLDWRTIALSSHGQRYSVTFPGKALSAQKTVLLANEPHSLTLHAVQSDSAQFALGHLAAKDAEQAQALANALAHAFANNMGGEFKRVTVTVPKTMGAFDVSYPSTASRYAQARFLWTASAAYELLALGKPQDLNSETADTFIRSLRFE
jgi:hypothetical protein